jgi:hypothetical protein
MILYHTYSIIDISYICMTHSIDSTVFYGEILRGAETKIIGETRHQHRRKVRCVFVISGVGMKCLVKGEGVGPFASFFHRQALFCHEGQG